MGNLFFLILEILSKTQLLIGYISGNNSFPEPLSAKEEEYYFEQFKKGDKAAKDILVERNLRLVAHIVKKYQTGAGNQEDLISIGIIGLIKAVNTFDNTKGIRLATYASRCIDNEILMVMRSAKKTQSDVSLQEPIGTDSEGNDIALIDILQGDNEDISDEVEKKMQIGILNKNMDKVLTKREKTIIELRFGIGGRQAKTQKEIAKMLGISRSYVSRIEKRAIGKLGKLFEENE